MCLIAHQKTIALLLTAGQEILRIRREGLLNARMKSDAAHDVLTDADIAASRILTEGLAEIFPGVQLISEEDEAHCPTAEYDTAIVIDPIDGTRNFQNGKPGFGILIGMVEDKVPVRGYAYYPDPRFSALFYTDPVERKAFRQEVLVDDAGAVSLGDKTELTPQALGFMPRVIQTHTDVSDFFPRPYYVTQNHAPAATFAVLAGQADVVAGPHTMKDWDLAALDAIARACGAAFINVATGQPLIYGEKREAGRSYMQPRYVCGNQRNLQSVGLMQKSQGLPPQLGL